MVNSGFWNKLKKPIMILAPMADVTDSAFRRLIAKYGKPDVMFTEFISADGLNSSGRDVLMRDLEFSESERPIVAQFFTKNIDSIKNATSIALNLGFDGIDINMGCPDRNIEKQGAGASLIKDPKRAKELIKAAKEIAGDIPVSVKTRVGYNQEITKEWVEHLLEVEPAAIILHARTRKELSKVPANWDYIKEAVQVAKGSGTLIIGNGDVMNLKEANEKVMETGADGVMIGKGIFGNPWLFSGSDRDISVEERLNVMLEHTKLFEELLGDFKNFAIMKKHYKAYVNGFLGAKELRIKLMSANNGIQVNTIIREFLLDKEY